LLTWTAVVTKRVKLGTAVLGLAMRRPLPLAKELAALQDFSEERLRGPRRAFEERGRRLDDEGIAMMRAVWPENPVTFRNRRLRWRG
jgi:alkanesulfonate monooxygenase SsuD/methylene tetrahydromethanopterin reductase-like flavin-dependent oxidoreductase (luciferase family)